MNQRNHYDALKDNVFEALVAAGLSSIGGSSYLMPTLALLKALDIALPSYEELEGCAEGMRPLLSIYLGGK